MSAVMTPHLSVDVEALDLLTFYVGGQSFSLPVANIARIIEMVTIIHLPGVPDIIQGIINVQGKAVPVMDLRRRFGLPLLAYSLHTPIILTETNGYSRQIGLVVDEVEDVFRVPHENLEIAEAFIPTETVGQISGYLAGVAKIERRMVIVLDARALLTPAEENQLSEVLMTEDIKVS